MPIHSDGGAGGVMLRVDRRAGGIGGGSGCNTMPPKPLKGDFLFPPPLHRTPVPARGRVVRRAILVVLAGCVVVDEPNIGRRRSCSRR